MRFVNYFVLAVMAVIVIFLSVANRQVVPVHFAPDFSAYGTETAPTFTAPLFLVALACAAVGFVLGAFREYFRESKVRRRSSERRKELGRLQREVDTLKKAQNLDEEDEIIALTSR